MKTAVRVVIYTVASLAVIILSLVIYGSHQNKIREEAREKQKLIQENLALQAKLAQKPKMPVEILFRKALLDSSYVVIFKNDSSRDLQVMGTFINPTTKNRKTFTISMAPHGQTQVGYAQGFAFHSGDNIYLQHADYSNKDANIP